MLNKNKSQNFLLYPKEKFIYKAKNSIKISGVCTTPEGTIPEHILVKIGKRQINCQHREGNQFWFEFKVGTGFKLVKVYSKHKGVKRSINWFLYFIKKKEKVVIDESINFNSYLNWLKINHILSKIVTIIGKKILLIKKLKL